MYEVLYSKRKDIFGYFKISAIRTLPWEWGDKELDANEFGVLKLDLTAQQITDWSNLNKYCVNDTEDNIMETLVEYQRKRAEYIRKPK